mmetsp:Transcript_92783/g.267891  ORF Transcript_92783/g.267891 Transcript_92783/m.267891 type:complete len:202 (+) Transcript_92783:348-953(+)
MATEKKVFDESDEAFCGFISLQTLDQDGISGRTLGAMVKAPLHITSEPGADQVVMEALFLPANPLFYLELRSEEQYYLWGQCWMDGPTYSEAKTICVLNPVKMQDCHKHMEKSGGSTFPGAAMCEALRDSAKRQFAVEFTTEEKKFKTKLSKVVLTIPREAWMEFKQHRVRMWKSSKTELAGAGGGDDDKKKEEGGKKDED